MVPTPLPSKHPTEPCNLSQVFAEKIFPAPSSLRTLLNAFTQRDILVVQAAETPSSELRDQIDAGSIPPGDARASRCKSCCANRLPHFLPSKGCGTRKEVKSMGGQAADHTDNY